MWLVTPYTLVLYLLQLGDVFTILAAGKRMTFLFSHDQTHLFFQSTQADFQAAVQPFTQRAGLLAQYRYTHTHAHKVCVRLSVLVAGVPRSSFHQHHTSVHDGVKGRLTAQLGLLCPALSAQLYRQLHSWLDGRIGGGAVELMDFVRGTMFPAVVRQLFGTDNIQLSDVSVAQYMYYIGRIYLNLGNVRV